MKTVRWLELLFEIAEYARLLSRFAFTSTKVRVLTLISRGELAVSDLAESDLQGCCSINSFSALEGREICKAVGFCLPLPDTGARFIDFSLGSCWRSSGNCTTHAMYSKLTAGHVSQTA